MKAQLQLKMSAALMSGYVNSRGRHFDFGGRT
jgi:hypothetical protein